MVKLSKARHLTTLWLQDAPISIADLTAAECNPIIE
jgi:hypothetical protein